MTEKQRIELAEKVSEYLAELWEEFTDDDTARVYDYCKDEAEVVAYPFEDVDIFWIATAYEMKYC